MVLRLVTPRVVIILADLYTGIPLTDAIGYYHQSQLHTVCATSTVSVTKSKHTVNQKLTTCQMDTL